MADRQATPSPAGTKRGVLGLVVSCYLLAEFIWRVFTTAHEYPMRPEQVVSISLDLLAVIGLISIRASIPKPLFWLALIAGVALFAIRLHSDASWWTGHWSYSLD
jgi:hypothetical protein